MLRYKDPGTCAPMDVEIPGSEDLWILGICGSMDVEVHIKIR